MPLANTTAKQRCDAYTEQDIAQRRLFLGRCVGLASVVAIAPVYARQLALQEQARAGHEQFITQALRMKKQALSAGDQPYGAIVVKDNRVVGFGPSRVINNQDPTAHAEMEAIRDAARKLGTRDLSGCILYSTSRPCRMCETAAYWANISTMYFGDIPSRGGKPDYGC